MLESFFGPTMPSMKCMGCHHIDTCPKTFGISKMPPCEVMKNKLDYKARRKERARMLTKQREAELAELRKKKENK